MKTAMSVLVMLMAFALVSTVVAGTGSPRNELPAVSAGTQNAPAGASNKKAVRPNPFPSFQYCCGVKSPAYTDYIDAVAIPCDKK